MWPHRRLVNTLTPVREESVSSKQRGGRDTPHRSDSNEMEPTDLSNGASAGLGESGSPTAADGRKRGANVATENQALDSGILIGENSTAMASPTLGDEKQTEEEKYATYIKYVYMSAALGTTIESFAILAPLLLTTFFSLAQDISAPDSTGRVSLVPVMFLKAAIFFGIPVGNILATSLSRRYNQKDITNGFLALIFFSVLAMTLTGDGRSIDFVSIVIFWRALIGVGVGGCRGANALASVRITKPKWRGCRMAYISAHSAMGYSSVFIAGISAVGFWRSGLSKSSRCDAECRTQLDKSWRMLSGALLITVAVAFFARMRASSTAPHPNNTSRVILKFSPSFTQFASAYRKAPRYLWPLLFMCCITFPSSVMFYGMLLNLTSILERAGFLQSLQNSSTVAEYLHRVITGWAILASAGIVAGQSSRLDGIRIAWIVSAGSLLLGFLGAFGLVETARKEIGVIEGEVYGDWGKWDDRRKMRPEQRMQQDEES
ncbi:hypothetical protein DRE_04934 [Drechslerella stenobrocha 248]|uniref:Major facilitator superfamily (MFS) profile domain-containing protein n=1 Tax=Drechslerella stenobrocha 248 TaxID=1043628 RepID=W7I0B7_9PEZI|nr:hypothetical protein DRE_04934 [Drechslerella stenobrocha 248]